MNANTVTRLGTRLAFAVLAISLGLVSLSGCSHDESAMAPEFISQEEEPEFGYDTRGDRTAPAGWYPSSFQLIEVEKSIWPFLGGVLQSGRFTLTVPPGATDRRETFEMSYELLGPVEVSLYPHGLEFAPDAPVELKIDLRWTTLAQYEDVTLYWYDEEQRKWVDVGGDWDFENKVLTTELEHFSTYRSGRAGW